MGAQSPKPTNKDTNRSLVRIFSICLSTLVLCYSAMAFRLLLVSGSFDFATLFLSMLRIALGVAALIVIINPPWLARPLERQVDSMGSLFETGYDAASTKEKIRLIVLVTMVSLLLELVMIRWLASVFPVFAFFKNFTLLACFLGLGAGYAVAEKQRCAPALVLPMLALFVLVITLLRYDLADQGNPVRGAADARANLRRHRDGQFRLVHAVPAEHAALSAAGDEFHSVRLHLLSGRPAVRQIAAQRERAESLWP